MRQLFSFVFLLIVPTLHAQQNLSVHNSSNEKNNEIDWLVNPVSEKAMVYKSADNNDIILSNGLLKRTFRIQPNLVCRF